jgi:branched-chain amino acid transport system permease protein
MRKIQVRPSALAVAVALILLLIAPFVLPMHPVQLLTEALVVGTTTMSFIFLFGYAGLASMAQMAYFAVSGYVIAVITVSHSGNFWLAAIAGVLGAGVVSLLFALVAYRSQGIFFLMMTLAMSQLVYGVATEWAPVTGGYRGIAGIPRPSLGGLNFSATVPRYYLFILIATVVYLVLKYITVSEFGLGIRAQRENPIKAEALGIDVKRQRLAAHVIAGLTAGVAGVMGVIHYGVVSPETTGLKSILTVIMSAIVGGTFWLEGGVLGSVIVVILISVVSGITERYWMIVGSLFVVMIIFLPRGLIGAGMSIGRRFRRRAKDVAQQDEAVLSGIQ